MNDLKKNEAKEITVRIKNLSEKLKAEISKAVIGQTEIIDAIITAILCSGHCLLIGAPGLAKTLLVKTLAATLALDFKRVQFTPDLMPADIIGAEILQIDPENGKRYFIFNKGPVFTNILLADEINRTPPKTQSALLEAMQETSITAGGINYEFVKPFFVLATQNPLEQEGTYPLPEAQLDRFMFSLKINYPSFDEERQIIKATTYNNEPVIKNIISRNELLEAHNIVRDIVIADDLINYALKITRATRPAETTIDEVKKNISWGAGPRASQYIILSAKASALMNGRMYCVKEDILKYVYNALNHRIILNFNAAAENISTEDIIKIILNKTSV